METPNIDAQYQAVCRTILKGQWNEAFKQMHKQLHKTKDQLLPKKLDNLERGYAAAIEYMLTGIDDPHMQDLCDEARIWLLRLASAIARDRKLREDVNVYSVSHVGVSDQKAAQDDWMGQIGELMLQLADIHDDDERRFTICDSLFNCVFTSPLLADDDAQLQLTTMIDSMEPYLQAYLVSALTLSCYTFFCDRKMAVLCHFIGDEWPEEVRARALVGVMFVYNRFHRQIAVFPHLAEHISDIMEHHADDLAGLYQEWVMTCSTNELHRFIEDKLMPTLLKGKKMGTAQFEMEGHQTHVIKIDASNPEDDPDPTRRSALFNFVRLLRHGADTNFATFAGMKRFDFFMLAGHWLMPFCSTHPLVRRATIGATEDFFNTMMLGTNLCSSDMYSMCSMLTLTSGQARENMFRSMTNQIHVDDDLDEEEREEILHDALAEQINMRRRMRGYLQDWYRFVMLHPAKNELENPFQGTGLFLAPFWKPLANDESFLYQAAEFFSNIEKHGEAIEMFRRYLKLVPDDVHALIQLGKCYMATDTPRPAAECFRRAMLAGGDEEDCLSLLCHCLAQGRNFTALQEAAERLSFICPHDAGVQIIKATAIMRSGRYEEALAKYCAIELLNEDEKHTKQASRGAAWCLFCLRRFDEALARYDRFIDDGDVRHEDLLNRGHVLWGMRRTQEAADSYLSHIRLFTESTTEGKAMPMKVFDEDVPELMSVARLNATQVALMRDYLLSQT